MFGIAAPGRGLCRQAGTHAGGVLIERDVLTEYTPVFNLERGQAAQFNMEGVEDVSLVKFDFLGLKNLDIITYAKDLVNEEVERANSGDEAQRAQAIKRFRICEVRPEGALAQARRRPRPARPRRALSGQSLRGIRTVFFSRSDGMKSMLVGST